MAGVSDGPVKDNPTGEASATVEAEERELERSRRGLAAALCMQCGLCCDGTFFGSVVIADDESDRLRRVGLPVVGEDGARTMRQPCSALRDCLCDVYAERPKACRTYECDLRVSVLDGSTNEASAHLSLARMHALLATVRAAFDVKGTSIWEAVVALDGLAPLDRMTPEGRRFDEGIAAVSELLDLARSVFEPHLGGASPGKEG